APYGRDPERRGHARGRHEGSPRGAGGGDGQAQGWLSGTFCFFMLGFFARRAKKPSIIGLAQLHHSASQRHVFACGSKVHAELFACGFPRVARKTAHNQKESTALPKAQRTNWISPNTKEKNTLLPQAKG